MSLIKLSLKASNPGDPTRCESELPVTSRADSEVYCEPSTLTDRYDSYVITPPYPKNLYAHYQNYSFHGTVIHRATLCKLIPYTHSQNSTTGSVAVWPAVPFAVPFTKVVHSSVFHQLPQVAHGNGDWNTREHSNSYHPRQRRLDIGLEYRRENSYTEYVVTRNRL